jgi:hypothetical protein
MLEPPHVEPAAWHQVVGYDIELVIIICCQGAAIGRPSAVPFCGIHH